MKNKPTVSVSNTGGLYICGKEVETCERRAKHGIIHTKLDA